MIYRVSKEFTFCYAHRILGHKGKCSRLHGHNGKVIITLESEELDPLGMVRDFDEIKTTIGGWIEQNLDHKTILEDSDPLVETLVEERPDQCLSMANSPTAENLAALIYNTAKDYLLPVAEVSLWETETSSACYRG